MLCQSRSVFKEVRRHTAMSCWRSRTRPPVRRGTSEKRDISSESIHTHTESVRILFTTLFCARRAAVVLAIKFYVLCATDRWPMHVERQCSGVYFRQHIHFSVARARGFVRALSTERSRVDLVKLPYLNIGILPSQSSKSRGAREGHTVSGRSLSCSSAFLLQFYEIGC